MGTLQYAFCFVHFDNATSLDHVALSDFTSSENYFYLKVIPDIIIHCKVDIEISQHYLLHVLTNVTYVILQPSCIRLALFIQH